MSILEYFKNKKLETKIESDHTKKPQTNSKGSFKYIKTPSEKVRWIDDEFEEAKNFKEDDIERNSLAWKMYSGFENGQWPEAALSELNNDGRDVIQINFIRGKVDGLAGSMMKKYFDIGYEPVNGEHTDMTRLIKELWVSDKELLDYRIIDKDAVIDGLIFESIQEMYINTRYDPLGNIAFRRVMPGHVVLDPNWLSNDSWDLKRLWKVSYMTADEIKEKYKTKSSLIDAEILSRSNSSSDFDNGDDNKGFPHFDLNSQYGEKYRVIEFHHIEKKNKKMEISISNGEVIPEGSDAFRQEWARINNVDLEAGIIEKKYDVDEYYVSTICPELLPEELLEDRKSPIQIGRLPFFIWSSGRINGKNSGIPDLIKSLQQIINYRESLINGIISTNAANGIMVDPELFDNDENMMQQFQKNKNKVGWTGFTAPGRLASGRNYTQEIRKASTDFTILQQENRAVDMLDRVSAQPAASDARSEGAAESGILFARKTLQAEVKQAAMFESFRHFLNEKGEAYLLLAKQLYSGVYRSFNKFGEGGDKIELNKQIFTPSGLLIENDISQLPRMKVMVTESPESPTQRNIDRVINVELLRVIGESNPISRAQSVKNIMKTLDVSKADRNVLEKDAELERVLAEESVKTQIMNMKFQQLQIQSQMSQMGGGAPQQGQPQEQPQGQGQQQGPQPEAPGQPQQNMFGSDREIARQS